MPFPKKASRWICSCKRINNFDEHICGYCQQKRPGSDPEEIKEAKQKTKIKKVAAYDELHLWPIFSKYIRLRDTDKKGVGRCFTCGRVLDWKSGDSGHGVPRQHKGTKYNEKNNHLQCKPCNGFQGGARELYKAEMDKRYGPGTWDTMIVASRQTSKAGKFEYDTMAAYYGKEVERLLKEKNIIEA